MQLIYPPRAKSIFIHSSAPVAESEKDFPHWNPQFLGPGPPPTAQTGHALESSNPDKQWLHKLHQLVSNQHEVLCCPPARAPGARMSPDNTLILRISVPFSWSSKGSREGEVSQQSDNPAHPHAATGQCLQPLQEMQTVLLTKQVLGTMGHTPTVPVEAGCWQTLSPGGWGKC